MNAQRPYEHTPSAQIEANIEAAIARAIEFRETGNDYRYLHHAERVRKMRAELRARERQATR
jgi:hypothetical protein